MVPTSILFWNSCQWCQMCILRRWRNNCIFRNFQWTDINSEKNALQKRTFESEVLRTATTVILQFCFNFKRLKKIETSMYQIGQGYWAPMRDWNHVRWRLSAVYSPIKWLCSLCSGTLEGAPHVVYSQNSSITFWKGFFCTYLTQVILKDICLKNGCFVTARWYFFNFFWHN